MKNALIFYFLSLIILASEAFNIGHTLKEG